MNQNFISIAALLLSVFFAGAYLRGEIGRRAELKAELKEMKELQRQLMIQVDSINASYAQDKLDLLRQTHNFYSQLDTIIRTKFANTQQIRRIQKELQHKENELSVRIGILKETARRRRIDFSIKPE
jgi:hypothetical protein